MRGWSTTSQHPNRPGPGGHLAWPSWRRSSECLGEIEEAEALGYQTVWLSQHHLTWDGFVSSPEAHDRS